MGMHHKPTLPPQPRGAPEIKKLEAVLGSQGRGFFVPKPDRQRINFQHTAYRLQIRIKTIR